MKGKLKLKNVKKSTGNSSGNISEVSPNRSALREIILSIRKRDVSVSEKDRGSTNLTDIQSADFLIEGVFKLMLIICLSQ